MKVTNSPSTPFIISIILIALISLMLNFNLSQIIFFNLHVIISLFFGLYADHLFGTWYHKHERRNQSDPDNRKQIEKVFRPYTIFQKKYCSWQYKAWQFFLNASGPTIGVFAFYLTYTKFQNTEFLLSSFGIEDLIALYIAYVGVVGFLPRTVAYGFSLKS